MNTAVPLHATFGPSRAAIIVNALAFQFGWFACVLGAAHGLSWVGPVVVAALLALHLYITPHRLADLKLVLVAVIAGMAWDSLLLRLGWLSLSGTGADSLLAPLWIVALWALFASTLNASLRWLQPRPRLALVFGALGGPLAYVAGERIGAVELLAPVPALIGLALGWALFTLVLSRLAHRWVAASNPERRS